MAQVRNDNQSSGVEGGNPVETRNPTPNHSNGEDRLRMMEQMMMTLGAALQRQIERDEAQVATAAAALHPQFDYLKMVNEYRPPTYEGQEDPEKLEEWISTFDKLLTVTRCPDERKVEVATYYLTKLADQWWRDQREGLAEGYGWENLKQDLRDQFFSMSLRNAKYAKFVTLRQGNMTVKKYYVRFMELISLATDIVMTEKEKAQKFEIGLKDSLRRGFGGK